MDNETIDVQASEGETPRMPTKLTPRQILENHMPLRVEASGLNRSTDQVTRDMRVYVDDGRISAEGHAEFVWLFHHSKTEKRLTSWDDVGKLIGMSGTTISRLFAGKYNGSLDNVLEAVQGYRHVNAEREKMSSDTFIETSIWEKVRNVCDLALLRSSPVRIVGPSQIGKTHSMLEYRRRAKFNVFYCRVPAAPTFRDFQKSLAASVGLNTSLRAEEIRARLPNALNQQTLLMVDELHELALSAGKGTAMKCMEWLREIWDVSHCGLAVCGTRSMEDDLMYGAMKGWLDQFDQRCIRKLELPNRLPASDIALAAAAYGFPPPDGSVSDILAGLRMNRLCAVLNMSASAANKRGDARTWDLFARVYNKNFGGR